MPEAKKCTGCARYYDPPFHGWFILAQLHGLVTPKVAERNPQIREALLRGLIPDDQISPTNLPNVNGEFHNLGCLVNYVNSNYDLLALDVVEKVPDPVAPPPEFFLGFDGEDLPPSSPPEVPE